MKTKLVLAVFGIVIVWQFALLQQRKEEVVVLRQKLAEPPKVESASAPAAAAAAAVGPPRPPQLPWTSPVRVEKRRRYWQGELDKFQSADRRRVERELADPRTFAIVQQQCYVGLDTRYASLFAKLKLGPEETARLKTLLVDRIIAEKDAYAAGNDLTPAQRKIITSRMLEDVESVIAGELGEGILQEVKHHEQTTMARERVQSVERRLGYSATPLAENSRSELVNIFHRLTAPPRPDDDGLAKTYDDYLTRLSQHHRTVVENASPYLSADQAKALTELLAEEENLERLGRAMRLSSRN